MPDDRHRVVVVGLGELHGLDTLAAAATRDGRTLVAYAPSPRTVVIDLTQPKRRRFGGYWWDPRGGRKVDIAAMDGGRTVELRAPFDEDAALVLQAP